MFFLVRNTYVDDPRLAEIRAAHRAHLGGLRDALVAAGPVQAERPSGQMLFEVGDADELDALLAADPLAEAGLIASQEVAEWMIILGRLAEHG